MQVCIYSDTQPHQEKDLHDGLKTACNSMSDHLTSPLISSFYAEDSRLLNRYLSDKSTSLPTWDVIHVVAGEFRDRLQEITSLDQTFDGYNNVQLEVRILMHISYSQCSLTCGDEDVVSYFSNSNNITYL